ncbi:MAG: hypothetical protein NUV92_01950 [Ignavibacteria bacterium]|jgi:hypothetical protein|nr:hypothetical protein [Ignavibacteria bacterium]MDH7526996.1 hypothetical protein [Ignavibacteria bacterium]
MGRAVIIILIGALVIFGLYTISSMESEKEAYNKSFESYRNNYVRNISLSMIDILMMKLADSSNYRVNQEQKQSLLGGTATFTIKDTVLGSDSVVQIRVLAEYEGIKKESIAYVTFGSGFVPPVLRGVVTANANLNKTISDMIIDGRDHDLNGNLIPKNGIYGVSSGTSFSNLQGAMIGGTVNGVDYPPKYPEDPRVIEQNYNWGGSFPTSPDQILGYPEGTLKSIAQSKVKGSQYVTNISQLKYPLSGVTYLELSSAEVKIDLGKSDNWGILVVHNSTGSTRVTQLKSSKPFKGLIIGDYMFHLHLDILGGLILLSPNLEMTNECKGNNDHKIYYSSAAIKNATFFANSVSGQTGIGGGKRSLSLLYLFE